MFAEIKVMQQEQTFTKEWLGRDLIIKTGKLARQATAAITVQYGETVILATVVESQSEREGIDYFPLSVDFEERLYAAGIIKGSRWMKREGRPSDDSVLTGRMVDRSIRPLFDQSGRKDVQIILTVLSVDQKNDYDIVSLIAASAVLSISGIDWRGPIGGVRVGRVNGELIFNPTYEERLKSDLDLTVAGTEQKVIMIEAGASEVNEADMLKAIQAGQKVLSEPINLIIEMEKEVGFKKDKLHQELYETPPTIEEERKNEELDRAKDLAINWLDQNVEGILFNKEHYTKSERKMAVRIIKESLDEFLFKSEVVRDNRKKLIKELVEARVEAEITEKIIKNQRRVDGRNLNQIRSLSSEVAIIPRVHGSSLFSRGETQVMSILTLGSPGMQQTLENMEGESQKRYIHHYNFAPFSVGEARFMRGPGRREIGHGALAEKALMPVLPSEEDFPYTIRVVSETLGSNGSSSMGATCASCLALLDAGVPIKKKVAGIAMGLASTKNLKEWEILTDIQDLEDGEGGMDFKIAGTEDGITAIQLDTKTEGLTLEIVEKTLNQGRAARLEILKVMDQAIAAPRAELSPYAPRLFTLQINPEKIGDVIGPGGKIINKITTEYEVTIDIEDDGKIVVCGVDAEKALKAIDLIKAITKEFVIGEKFTGKVIRIESFGAFVELTPGNDGLVHVSELAPYRVGQVKDFVKLGDIVTVIVKEIDDKGRVNLTMLGLPENEPLWKDNKGKEDSGGFGRRPGGFNERPTFRGPRPPRR